MKKFIVLKTAKNDSENDDSDFLEALYSVQKKSGQFYFYVLFANLFKQSCISSVMSHEF